MPYDIKRNYGGCSGYAVVGPGGTKGCHSTRGKAVEQQRALYAAESQTKKSDTGIITNQDVPQPYPHSIEDCPDLKNCPDHMASYDEEANKKAPCWDGYVQRGMKPGEGGRMVPNCVPVAKLEDCCPDMIKMENPQEGMFVMGPGNEYTKEYSHGKIEHVMRDGSLGPGSKFEIQATMEDPALLIRIYKQTENGWEETDLMTGFKSSEATLVGNEQDMQEHAMEKRSLEDLDLKPTESMASNARRGLELRRKFGRGGTAVGVARARDLSNRNQLSPDTVLRMYSFFSRHEVDKKGKDFNNSERPSNGKIAWLLWGGDSGFAWAKSKRNAIMNIRSQKSNDAAWQDSAFSFKKYLDN
jgi:hypothetical protein